MPPYAELVPPSGACLMVYLPPCFLHCFLAAYGSALAPSHGARRCRPAGSGHARGHGEHRARAAPPTRAEPRGLPPHTPAVGSALSPPGTQIRALRAPRCPCPPGTQDSPGRASRPHCAPRSGRPGLAALSAAAQGPCTRRSTILFEVKREGKPRPFSTSPSPAPRPGAPPAQGPSRPLRAVPPRKVRSTRAVGLGPGLLGPPGLLGLARAAPRGEAAGKGLSTCRAPRHGRLCHPLPPCAAPSAAAGVGAHSCVAALEEELLLTCQFPTKHKAPNLRRFPCQCSRCPVLLGPHTWRVLSGQLPFSHPLSWQKWRSLGFNCRPLTFCSHLAGDRGAELNWFLHLGNIWSTCRVSVTESLQPGAQRWSVSEGPPDAAAAQVLYKIGSSGFAEALERCTSIVTLYLRPGLVIQWEQVEILLYPKALWKWLWGKLAQFEWLNI